VHTCLPTYAMHCTHVIECIQWFIAPKVKSLKLQYIKLDDPYTLHNVTNVNNLN